MAAGQALAFARLRKFGYCLRLAISVPLVANLSRQLPLAFLFPPSVVRFPFFASNWFHLLL